MRSSASPRGAHLIAVAKSLLFAAGVVAVTTTWIVVKGAIHPGVFTVPMSAASAFVILYQGLPIAALFVGGELARKRGSRALLRYRVITLAIAASFLALQLGGGVLEALFDELPDAGPVRWVGLIAYVGGAVTAVVVITRLRGQLATRASGVVEMAGVGGLLIAFILPAGLQSTGAGTRLYAIETSTAKPASERDVTAPPIFVFVFDELAGDALLDASGTIDAQRFPNFAALASRGTVYTNANANFFNTHFAVPALAEGLSTVAPLRAYSQFREAELALGEGCTSVYYCKGASYLGDEHSFDIFKHMMLSTAAEFVPAPWSLVAEWPLRSASQAVGVPLATVDPDGIHLFTEAHIELFLDELDSEDPHGSIYLVHTLSSHYPYVRDAEGGLRERVVTRGDDGFLREAGFRLTSGESSEGTPPDEGPIYSAYLDQITYADQLLGLILEQLDARGLLDEAIIVATADHGMRPEFVGGTTPATIDSWVTRVPLIISAPGQTATVTAAPIQHAGLPVTIAELAGVPLDSLDQSIAAANRAPSVPWFVVHGRWVYHRTDSGEWELVTEFPEQPFLDRADFACFADPEGCDRSVLQSPEAGRSTLPAAP
jgi:hypothetical protein